jgi:hypothetical protein
VQPRDVLPPAPPDVAPLGVIQDPAAAAIPAPPAVQGRPRRRVAAASLAQVVQPPPLPKRARVRGRRGVAAAVIAAAAAVNNVHGRVPPPAAPPPALEIAPHPQARRASSRVAAVANAPVVAPVVNQQHGDTLHNDADDDIKIFFVDDDDSDNGSDFSVSSTSSSSTSSSSSASSSPSLSANNDKLRHHFGSNRPRLRDISEKNYQTFFGLQQHFLNSLKVITTTKYKQIIKDLLEEILFNNLSVVVIMAKVQTEQQLQILHRPHSKQMNPHHNAEKCWFIKNNNNNNNNTVTKMAPVQVDNNAFGARPLVQRGSASKTLTKGSNNAPFKLTTMPLELDLLFRGDLPPRP